jgi:GcrA cell cycle regulator
MKWGKALDASLRAHWGEGHTAAVIASLMGVSRNAVIGRAHRLKLAKREKRKRISPATTRRPQRPHIPKKPSAPRFIRREPMIAPGSLDLTIMQLEPHQCRWITSGAGTDAFYCGHSAAKPHGYCEAHHAIAYAPADQRSQRPAEYYLFRRAA